MRIQLFHLDTLLFIANIDIGGCFGVRFDQVGNIIASDYNEIVAFTPDLSRVIATIGKGHTAGKLLGISTTRLSGEEGALLIESTKRAEI